MGIEYVSVDWIFDVSAWCAAVRKAVSDDDVETWAELLECHENTLQRWRSGRGISKPFPYPNMTNFLKFCNALDLDPREFFTTSGP